MSSDDSWRSAVVRRSGVFAAYLGGLPRWIPLVAVAALMVGGLLVGGIVGAILLMLVCALAGWLVVLNWDHLAPPARVLRLMVITMLFAVAVYELLPR